jgi:hypothetical protein
MPGFLDVVTEPLGLESLNPNQSQAIKDGIEEYNTLWSRKYPLIKSQVDQGDERLGRLFAGTHDLLMYELDTRQLHTLVSFIKTWKKIGNEKIVDALNARLDQLMSPQTEKPVESDDDYQLVEEIDIVEEEAPETMRSVAKVLRYANVFHKVARG